MGRPGLGAGPDLKQEASSRETSNCSAHSLLEQENPEAKLLLRVLPAECKSVSAFESY